MSMVTTYLLIWLKRVGPGRAVGDLKGKTYPFRNQGGRIQREATGKPDDRAAMLRGLHSLCAPCNSKCLLLAEL